MRHIYHYHATHYRPETGSHDDVDGILSWTRPITTMEHYREAKQAIANGTPPLRADRLTIKTLTLLHTLEDEEPRGMTRTQRLEARVALANTMAPHPFVPGTGPGSTAATYGMEVSKGGDWWNAFVPKVPSNPRGIRTAHGTGRTDEEAIKDVFAGIWLGGTSL